MAVEDQGVKAGLPDPVSPHRTLCGGAWIWTRCACGPGLAVSPVELHLLRMATVGPAAWRAVGGGGNEFRHAPKIEFGCRVA